MALTVASLQGVLSLNKSDFDSGLRSASTNLGTMGDRLKSAGGLTGPIIGGLGKIAAIGLGATVAGVIGLGAGLAKAASVGLGFNNTMEQVTAQLNAFTKDGAESARILNYLTQEAAKTPFAFEEMAKATAGLMPAAKASGIELEKLVSLSEILAASNPAQGLEGAAFSLREALSGDFVSIVERFNLPRQRLKELKEQGVPALEAISTAMLEMGLDTDLVTNLSKTASGRFSTFKDILTGLAATATQPIFDILSDGLGRVNQWLTNNQPLLQDMATMVGETLKTSFYRAQDAVGVVLGAIQGDTTQVIANLLNLGLSPDQALGIANTFNQIRDAIIEAVGAMQTNIAAFMDYVTPLFNDFAANWELIWPSVSDAFADAFSRIGTALSEINETFGNTQVASDPLKDTFNDIIYIAAGAAAAIQGVAQAIEWVNEALKIGAGLYDQLSIILGAGQTIGAGGNAFNAASMGGQAPSGFPGVPNISNNIQVPTTPVTINLDGKTIADNTSSYLGGSYLDYLAMGGVGVQ